jgi:tRNA nucleotidyltransferase/poly(A) polymerase
MALREELLRRFPALKRVPGDSYVVGGAIRDLLLGIDPVDVDVATADPLAAAQRISGRVIRLGAGEHLNAYRVVDGGHVYDFAALLDGDIGADLARRDFTVNAMAVPLREGELLDPHGGRTDLERRLVRMVDATNFDDDPLRCLKAVRLAILHRFEIDGKTLEAIRARAPRIVDIAPERVTYELSRILGAGQFVRAVALLDRSGLLGPLDLKPAAPPQAEDVSLAGAYAFMVEDPKRYAKRWRWSRDLLHEVTLLQELLAGEGDLLVALYDAGETIARQLPPLLRAKGRTVSPRMPDFSTRPLLTGEEIAAESGLPESPELGGLKRALLEAQIRGEVTTRQGAVDYVRRRSGR